LSAVKNDQEGEPGSVISTSPLVIGCGENSLEILSIKPEGKKEMTANEWVRGARISQGTAFR
jgi:methionyl-tRNA formyltransferase